MYTDKEMVSILLTAISTHPSLDHKLHLMESFESYSHKVEQLEKELVRCKCKIADIKIIINS